MQTPVRIAPRKVMAKGLHEPFEGSYHPAEYLLGSKLIFRFLGDDYTFFAPYYT